ncbi:MAG: hypothetical protein SNI58_05135 [Rikenellaceae bacterium]
MIYVETITKQFQSISLHEMDAVKLMNRTDRKYWFDHSLLGELLEDITNEYYILEINGQRNLPYSTTYL